MPAVLAVPVYRVAVGVELCFGWLRHGLEVRFAMQTDVLGLGGGQAARCVGSYGVSVLCVLGHDGVCGAQRCHFPMLLPSVPHT